MDIDPLAFNVSCAEFFGLEYKEDAAYLPALLAKDEYGEWQEFDAFDDANITATIRADLFISTIPTVNGYICECLHPKTYGVVTIKRSDDLTTAENMCIWHVLSSGLIDMTIQ